MKIPVFYAILPNRQLGASTLWRLILDFLILKLLKTTCCVKIYADINKNLGDNINGKIQQLET